jgi:hypothetical protein
MNFNKFYAALCGISTLTIFITYFFVYYKNLENFTPNLQYIVILVSSIAYVMSLFVLVVKFKLLFSKDYLYTTIILILISILAMWYNQFLFFKI